MKKKTLLLLTAALFMGINAYSQDQEQEEIQLKKFGLGFSFATLNFLEVYEYDYPTDMNKVYMPINVSNRFRIEPELSFGYYGEYREFYAYLGSGFLFQKQREHVNIIGGLRIGTSISDYYDISFQASPSIGAEYFFADRFSLGGEIQLRTVIYPLEGFDDNKPILISFVTPVSIRFYLSK